MFAPPGALLNMARIPGEIGHYPASYPALPREKPHYGLGLAFFELVLGRIAVHLLVGSGLS